MKARLAGWLKTERNWLIQLLHVLYRPLVNKEEPLLKDQNKFRNGVRFTEVPL